MFRVPNVPVGCLLHGVPYGQHCFSCALPAWPPAPAMSASAPSGWQCPSCRRVMAPSAAMCLFCPPKTEIVTGSGAPAQPAESCCVCGSPEIAYRNFKDLPFCRPCASGEPLGNLKPLHVEGMRCSPPCADGPCAGEPADLEATPARECPPSREGGMCRCGEPGDDEPARLTLRLPEYMGRVGTVHVAKIGREWREVFPGIEASLAYLDGDEAGAAATVHFRLAPQDAAR